MGGVKLGGTHLGDVDLPDVNGLSTVKHSRPSSLGIDTLCKANGRLPDEFCEGCGVSENLIVYAKSVMGVGDQWNVM
jgi:hypothetical protein